jgi:uncharacterized OsmC-like protein
MAVHMSLVQRKSSQVVAEESFTVGAGVRPRLEEAGRDVVATSVSEGEDRSAFAEVRGFGVVLDEPVALGRDTALPDPVELLLAMLANAHAVAYRTYARVAGLRLERVEVQARGRVDRVDPSAPFLDRVDFSVRVLSPEPLEALRALARQVEQQSPAGLVLRQPADVTSSLEVVSVAHEPRRVRKVA